MPGSGPFRKPKSNMTIIDICNNIENDQASPKYSTPGMNPQWKAVFTTSKTMPSRSLACSESAILNLSEFPPMS